MERKTLPNKIIASRNLFDFLQMGDTVYGADHIFSKQLDLSATQNMISQILSDNREGFALSAEARKRLRTKLRRKHLTPSERDIYTHALKLKGPVEKLTTMYYDHENGAIQYTPLLYGSFGEVMDTTKNVVLKGNIPMMEIHNHLLDYLPSPSDYFYLLCQPEGYPARILNSSMVLCPSISILSLATAKTPTFSPEQTRELITTHENQIRALIYAQEDSDLITLQAYLALIDSSYRNKRGILSLFPEWYVDTIRKVNHALVSFAGEMNILMYSSGDRKNFSLASG
ncbi:hypothetical protein HY468_02465 [Candidatus Roizmanbacteria bacterium]|nr:hypothetical protein [Candidatus Roizmanbacteria bacterium]